MSSSRTGILTHAEPDFRWRIDRLQDGLEKAEKVSLVIVECGNCFLRSSSSCRVLRLLCPVLQLLR